MQNNQRKIVAIGGGEIGRPREDGAGFYPIETTPIDREILALTQKPKAKLLFVPTASDDSFSYYQTVKKHFLSIGFGEVGVLELVNTLLGLEQIQRVVMRYDAIYVGGGNTLRMMKLWRKVGFDKVLAAALEKGMVLSGISAGSICWFDKGCSDSFRTRSEPDKLTYVTGLGFIGAVNCPHYDTEPHRQADIKNKMKKSSKVAIGIDNKAALLIIGDRYKIISSDGRAKVHRLFWNDNKFVTEELLPSNSYQKASTILKK